MCRFSSKHRDLFQSSMLQEYGNRHHLDRMRGEQLCRLDVDPEGICGKHDEARSSIGPSGQRQRDKAVQYDPQRAVSIIITHLVRKTVFKNVLLLMKTSFFVMLKLLSPSGRSTFDVMQESLQPSSLTRRNEVRVWVVSQTFVRRRQERNQAGTIFKDRELARMSHLHSPCASLRFDVSVSH